MNKTQCIGLMFLSLLPLGCRSSHPVVRIAHSPIAIPDRTPVTSDKIANGPTVSEPAVTLASSTVIAIAPELEGLPTAVDEPLETTFLVKASEQPIDMTTALMLTTGQNPQIAFARARIEEAQAQIDRANALKLPSIRAGINYNKHEGRIQDVAGTVIETSRGSFYSGFGANAVGAGSPAVPGLVSQFHFADAIFQPRIAQRTACARQAGAQATNNDMLLAAAIAYTELLRSAQELVVQQDIVRRAEKLEKTTAEFEKVGEGLASDHDRARVELALRKSELAKAEESFAVASARLAEIVRWDTDQRLVPTETQLVPIEMVKDAGTPRELVALALSSRPELAESRHLVGEAVERLKREQQAPLIPSVLLAASYGGLGGGLGSDLTNYGDRFDVDAVAFWEVRQLGVGERAIQRESRSRITQARMREVATMDRVAREVNESHAQIISRRKQIDATQEAVEAAEDSFERNWDRIENGKGLPIEVLQSLQALATAQREYTRAVADYNIAQFTLHRALGCPIDR